MGAYRESIGDRSGVFAAVADLVPVERAPYPGNYVDLSPSTAIRSVTYIDTDARAARFFADPALAHDELAGRTRPGAGQDVRFLATDYTPLLEVGEGSVDLLISLFAGPVSDHTRRYLRPGAWLPSRPTIARSWTPAWSSAWGGGRSSAPDR